MLAPGTYTLGPGDGELLVRTGRSGAAAKAGHDLTIEVTAWQATLEVGERTALELSADGASLAVRDGTGGVSALDDDDKRGIRQTIDEEILKATQIEFRSTSAEYGDGVIKVQGELELVGERRPINFELRTADDGTITGNAVVKQSHWGIKPYSTLFGTLKVSDEVEVTFAGKPARGS